MTPEKNSEFLKQLTALSNASGLFIENDRNSGMIEIKEITDENKKKLFDYRVGIFDKSLFCWGEDG